MARSHGIVKCSVWDVGSEFRSLPRDAQWAYVMLISQPQINNCGVLPFVPEKWARLCAGGTIDALEETLTELHDRAFIIIDDETGELLVRTFVKHDRIWKQPNLVTRARKEFLEIESETIRSYLAQAHPWLVEVWTKEEIAQSESQNETPSETPSRTPPRTPPRPRARVRTSPSPSPTPSPSSSDQKGKRRQNARGSRALLPAELEERLIEIGWDDEQREQAKENADLCWSWVKEARARFDVKEIDNEGGWAWIGYIGGREPRHSRTSNSTPTPLVPLPQLLETWIKNGQGGLTQPSVVDEIDTRERKRGETIDDKERDRLLALAADLFTKANPEPPLDEEPDLEEPEPSLDTGEAA
jgi:hypothetical protein